MAKREAVHQRYVIPENMIDGGKIMGFKARNIVEGVILGGAIALLSYRLLPFEEFSMRFSFTVILAAPFLALGAVGINGYPLTYFLKVAYQWLQARDILLYDHSVRLLEVSLLENRMNQTDLRDKVFNIYEKHISATRNKEKGKAMIEGVDFKFAQDKEEQAVLAKKNVVADVLDGDGFEEEISLLLPDEEAPAEALQEPSDDLIFEAEETDVSFVEIAPASAEGEKTKETESIEAASATLPSDAGSASNHDGFSAVTESDGEKKDLIEEVAKPVKAPEQKKAPAHERASKKKKKKKKGAGSRHG